MQIRLNRVRDGGFTLVELLVVVSIIGVLISLLLPALARSKFVAETILCRARMRQTTLAVLTYSNDFWNKTPGLLGPPYDYGSWILPVAPYMGFTDNPAWGSLFSEDRFKVMKCPTDITNGTYAWGAKNYFFTINWSVRTTWYYNAAGVVDAANSDDSGRRLESLSSRVFLFVDGGYSMDVLHAPMINSDGVQGDYTSYPTPLHANHEGWGNSMSRVDGSAGFYATLEQHVPVGTRDGSPWMYQSAWARPSWGRDTATAD
jgi:prepilin-type N-terminal cleavage/methylation domain-containing protein